MICLEHTRWWEFSLFKSLELSIYIFDIILLSDKNETCIFRILLSRKRHKRERFSQIDILKPSLKTVYQKMSSTVTVEKKNCCGLVPPAPNKICQETSWSSSPCSASLLPIPGVGSRRSACWGEKAKWQVQHTRSNNKGGEGVLELVQPKTWPKDCLHTCHWYRC